MRNAFASELTEIAKSNNRVVMLSGDIGNKLFDKFKAACPRQFFNCGIAEANLIGVAAGLAMSGFRPVAYTIVPFITTRCLEQIRVDVCYHHQPVIIVGVGGGLSYASLGGTHHSCEDIAMLRCLPHMQVVCPADAMEVRGAMHAAFASKSPTYIRIGKKGEPVFHDSPPDFRIGKSITLRTGTDAAILSTGNAMPLAVVAAERLQQQNVSVRVESFHTVKPLDEATLREVFTKYKAVVTLEEHSIIGGLGGAVAEWLADNARSLGTHAPLLRHGTADRFHHEAGSQEFARGSLGLSVESIVASVSASLATNGSKRP
jgi:transketolase